MCVCIVFRWEFVVLVRRSTMSFLYLTFFNDTGVRTYSLMVACVCAFALHLLALPYRQKLENYVEVIDMHTGLDTYARTLFLL